MAHRSNVPVLVLHKKDKKVSRLLRGNPDVVEIITYDNEEEVLNVLREKIRAIS